MQKSIGLSLGLVFMLTSAACTDDKKDDTPKYSSDAMTAQELCVYNFISERTTQCYEGFGPTIDEEYLALTCRAGGGSNWDFAVALLKAVDEGRVSINWAEGRECLEEARRLRSENSTSHIYGGLVPEWTALQNGVCKTFVSGASAAGATCTESWDCADGLGCYTMTPETASTFTCATEAAVDAECQAEYWPCATGSYCDLGTCVVDEAEALVEGDPCEEDYECSGAAACMTCRAVITGGAATCQTYGGSGSYCDDWNDCLWEFGPPSRPIPLTMT